jgi:stearoyl-CoA 9-desaturase NADPH oxidoreductase
LTIASAAQITAAAEIATNGSRLDVRQRLLVAVAWLTTPLLPDDHVSLVNPVWSSREPRARLRMCGLRLWMRATVIRPGRGWTGHRTGKYVRVEVDVDGVRQWRAFSLSSPPQRQHGCVTITVKATPDGFVSPYLVRRVRPGVIVRLTPAEGDPAEGEDVIFGDELRALAARFSGPRLYERHTRVASRRRRLTMAGLARNCPDWRARNTWACGPAGMLDDAETTTGDAPASPLGCTWSASVPRLHRAASQGWPGRFTTSGREADADGVTRCWPSARTPVLLMRLPDGTAATACVALLRSGRVRDLRTGREHATKETQTDLRVGCGRPVAINL